VRNASQSEWPKEGLEPFFDYVSDFIHLNINLGSATACRAYHDRWMQRYHAVMAEWKDIDVCRWSIRARQSLKSNFTATYFAISAQQLEQAQCWPAFYYLCYYSTFHSLWSVIYLHPQETVTTLSTITHSKLTNVFSTEFCSGSRPVIRYNARRLVEDLRYCREYYSYRMPLNSPFMEDEPIRTAKTSVGGLAKQCIQLANLHSHLVHKCAEKRGLRSASVPGDQKSGSSESSFKSTATHTSRETFNVLTQRIDTRSASFWIRGVTCFHTQ
jgi:hypothetical protein